MTNHGCHNESLDETKYSSPIPVIGLYVAMTSLVCMLLMLYDIVVGFRSKKRWLPCRLFTLNSVTLTLLSIATKLPVDLTTPMPSAQDQLCKLSGTTLLCISVGFLMPSLGTNRHLESLTNIAALSVFVITVAVNICMQIYTGVIFLFIAEHIALLCFMLILVMIAWFSAMEINILKEVSLDLRQDLLRKGKNSMLQRLKMCYVYGYSSNPQFVMSKHPACTTVGVLCLLCSIILLHAVYKSLIARQLKFCAGVSDYDWSIWIILATQILAIMVGSFGTSFRLITMFHHVNFHWFFPSREGESYSRSKLGIDFWGQFIKSIKFLISIVIFVEVYLSFQVYNVFRFFSPSCFGIFKHKYGENGEIEDYKDLVHVGNVQLDEYSVWKSVEEMKAWTHASERESPSHLSLLLHSRTLRLPTMDPNDLMSFNQGGLQVSSLSLVCLVRIAQVSLPDILGEALIKTFNEAYDIVHYIDKRINSSGFKNASKTELAKALWMGKDFTCLISQHSLSNADHAVAIITKLKGQMPLKDLVWRELDVIVDLINSRTYTSIEDLHQFIEQMFADMLHIVFAQLPEAIFKSVIESPIEEYEERVRLALQCFSSIESLEAHIDWSFPVGCNLTSLITTRDGDLTVENELNLTKDVDWDEPSTINEMFELNRYEWRQELHGTDSLSVMDNREPIIGRSLSVADNKEQIIGRLGRSLSV